MKCPDCCGRRTTIRESDGKELIETCCTCNGKGAVDIIYGNLSEASTVNESANVAFEEFMNRRISG